jgi:hypothetical protein
MSYMSTLEIKARNSFAITALNNLRHRIQQRADSKFSEENKQLILDSIELNESKELSSKALIYSFHGIPNIEKSSAIQLSDALNESIADLTKRADSRDIKSILSSVRYYLNNSDFESSSDRDAILGLIKKSISYLSSSVNADSSNSLIVYDI